MDLVKRRLGESLAIVITVPDEDGIREVWLMHLTEAAELDFDHEPFVLARTRTYEDAAEYARKLADILRLKVMAIEKT